MHLRVVIVLLQLCRFRMLFSTVLNLRGFSGISIPAVHSDRRYTVGYTAAS